MRVKIYYEDTDAGGIVYHANYIKFCERARSDLFFTAGRKFFLPSSHFVVSSLEAKFIKPSVLGDLLEIKTSVLEIKKTSLVLRQEIFRIGDINGETKPESVFAMNVTLAFLKDGKPQRLSEELLSFISSSMSLTGENL
ncbi:YbgC/FadM family acyl-CoA thioesterase [Campylobacter sp. RM13119]|uniref:YbgC/FadM family acyl-CoA thioesterase n=1 Tax=Campylobacter TaxID=194 RepID=UPI0014761096|nr:YbgC/FadM family acyl-CoA thioesterase [Campylobacter sp. RM13119]MBE3605409.1 YbgC/FadM family acyl-CoA thioesterase [Campylobacter sp. RM13119]